MQIVYQTALIRGGFTFEPRSYRREFVMLEEYLKSKGKKVKIIVFSDESIEGTKDLLKKLEIKQKR